MTRSELNAGINAAFYNLSRLNVSLYDYWLAHLYDLTQNVMIEHNWNEQTLYEMEKDVMFNS